jgi:hypothetical protein
MGALGILFGQKRTVIGAKEDPKTGTASTLAGILKQTIGGVAGIVVDATVSEEHVSNCETTDNPVEDGSDVTDHVHIKPIELTIDGVISDSPLGFAVVGNIQNFARSITNLFGKKTPRSIEAFNSLLDLQKSRTPFTVLTGLRRYENMILTELSVPRTSQTGAAIHFSAKMKQIRIVSSKTISGGGVGGKYGKTKNSGWKASGSVGAGSKLQNQSSSLSAASQSNANKGLGGWLNVSNAPTNPLNAPF